MKRKGYLFEHICSVPNLLEAHFNASRMKRKRDEVVAFEKDLMPNIESIRNDLLNKTYHTSEYSIFIKYEPKRREIYKLPYRDRVVQWAIMQVIEPIWVKCFTADTYACVKGRGLHTLLRNLRRDLRRDPGGTRYCFKMDVRKFYPSITHSILKEVVRQKFKDPDLLWLLDDIIDSADGVPIGNYISQYFANMFLSELDHQIKEFLHVKYYYRYADDIVVLSDSKQYLRGVQVYINNYLNTERQLEMKRNFQIFPVEARGIDFIGYVTRHAYCLARKRNKKALCKIVAKLRKKGHTSQEIRLMVASRMGFMVHCNSINLLRSLGIMKEWTEVKKKDNALTGSKLHIDTIINRELHVQAVSVKPSTRNDGNCLTIQYEILEQLRDKEGAFLLEDDAKTKPRMEWVQHITFTGSKKLQEDFDGVDFSEPVRCQIIRQPLDKGHCFYTVRPV